MTEIVSGAELWRARPRRGVAGDGCLNPVASILLSKAGAEPKCDAPYLTHPAGVPVWVKKTGVHRTLTRWAGNAWLSPCGKAKPAWFPCGDPYARLAGAWDSDAKAPSCPHCRGDRCAAGTGVVFARRRWRG